MAVLCRGDSGWARVGLLFGVGLVLIAFCWAALACDVPDNFDAHWLGVDVREEFGVWQGASSIGR